MHDLIKIENTTIGDESVPTVHEFLEVKTKFATWGSNRIDKYEFVENTDFTTISKNLENGGRLVEYHISLDMAKELCMVENNEKGREARRYFIECEKQLKQVLTAENQLILNTVLATTVEERVNISQIAKDYPISAIKLNKTLQEEGVQYKDKKGEWALYAKYKDRGYASTKTQVVKNGEYEVLKVHLKWTQRGRLFIYDLLKSKGILPICEQPC